VAAARNAAPGSNPNARAKAAGSSAFGVAIASGLAWQAAIADADGPPIEADPILGAAVLAGGSTVP
jgi:hypothetical protein